MSEFIQSTCPECQTKYRLKPDMVGKRMRCTNFDCQAAFEVIAERGAALGSIERTSKSSAARGGAPNGEFDWRTAPPPVQAVIDRPPVAEPQHSKQPPVASELLTPKPATRSLRRFSVVALSLFVVAATFTGIVMVVRTFSQAEANLAEDAKRAYEAGQFGRASEAYADLAEKHPSGIRAAEYRFKAALAKVRHRATLVPPDPAPALAELTKFMDAESRGPFFKANRVDVYEASLKVFNDLADEGNAYLQAKPPDVMAADGRATQARTALQFISQNANSNSDVAAPRAKHEALVSAVAVARARIAAHAEILALLGAPKPDLDNARELIHRAGFDDDSEVTMAWQRAEQTLRRLVAYRKMDLTAMPSAPPRRPVLYPDARPAAAAGGDRVPALARGILWALDAKSGRVAWVDRLGFDAVIPPRVLAASAGASENWLVIAADPPSLSLREAATGAIRWYQPLEAMPVGPIEIIGQRGFVALAGVPGRVLDFDTLTGSIHGQFEVGQALAGGLVHRSGTHLLYAAASSQQVYVFDIAPDDGAPPRCIDTLATGHIAGTLRHQPVILGDGSNQQLLLSTTGGVNETVLAMYRLDRPTAMPIIIATARVPGWISFAPNYGSEQIMTVTDQGVLGWFAYSHSGTSDPPLYRLDEREPAASEDGKPPKRAMIVHADESSKIVLADGRLTKWRAGIDRTKGRRLIADWSLDRPLGVPVHKAFPAGPGVVALTTLTEDSAGAVATAVIIDTGEVLWQRPLGLAPADQLVPLGNSIAVIDNHGATWRIDPPNEAGRLPMQSLGSFVGGLIAKPMVITADSGARWVVLSQDKQVIWRMLSNSDASNERKIAVPSPLSGTPAINGRFVVMPLANGSLVRSQLNEGGPVEIGPSWRTTDSDSNAIGYVLPTGPNQYVVSDGDRRVMSLRWMSSHDFQLDVRDGVVLSAPASCFALDPQGGYWAVADHGGEVTLFDQKVLTGVGKFGKHEASVSAVALIDGVLLFMLDARTVVTVPLATKVQRLRAITDGDEVVGGILPLSPRRYAVATQSGQLITLDDRDEGLNSKTQQLGAVSPVGGPQHFGGGLLVPLVDGTVTVVPLPNP